MQSRLTNPILLLALLVCVGLLAFRSGASFMSSAPQAAPIIATVNLEKLLNECAETAARDTVRKTKFQPRIDEHNALKARITTKTDELKAIGNTDPSAARDIQLEALSLKGQYDALGQFLSVSLSEDQAIALREVYMKSLAVIDAYAKANNISLVLADDSFRAPMIPAQVSKDDLERALTIQRSLYTSATALDITNDILTKLDNDFAAGGGKIAPANAAPAPKAAPKGAEKGAKK